MLETDQPTGVAGSDYTFSEIFGQPALWGHTYDELLNQQEALTAFLQPLWAQNNIEVILTGAGTSAFIGEALQGPFQKNTGKLTRAVATTDLVSHPSSFLRRNVPILLISFARSGNSPESVAAVKVANAACDTVYHLVITCNEQGQLAQQQDNRQYTLLLPPAAHDKGLAMTGSFSAMLLTGLLVSRLSSLASLRSPLQQLVTYGGYLLRQAPDLKKFAELSFERIVFLGSGPLRGTAQESHLKVQELTNGQVVGKHDSFLGFRHGPKVVANHQSLVVMLFSNDEYVRPYEVDLARELLQESKALFTVGVAERPVPGVEVDWWITMTDHGREHLDEEFLAVCSVLAAQIIGYYKSRQLGLNPDNPSVNGTISRVVQGVTIYPYPPSR